MDQNKITFTKSGMAEITAELDELKNTKLPAAIDRVARARDFGDLSENAEYDAAKEEQGLHELRISKLENTLSRARIIDTSNMPNDQVHILSKVKVKNVNNSGIFEYLLVSPEEADFQAGKLSITSPVGQGLMGKKVGDQVKVKAPAGILEFEILSIE